MKFIVNITAFVVPQMLVLFICIYCKYMQSLYNEKLNKIILN